MTDEEKKAIDDLILSHHSDIGISKETYFIIKNLIEKQQKEIEELRIENLRQCDIIYNLNQKEQMYLKEIKELKKPKYIIDCITNEITTLTNEFISKQKIKDKIETLNKSYENADETLKTDFYDIHENCTRILQELLEEE